ncbi:MAG TPA: hypothetical protein VNN80_01245, partial [Polyangiaceae bacterium]|nr:hypothetical protein [Polyangiaceae bacterium]
MAACGGGGGGGGGGSGLNNPGIGGTDGVGGSGSDSSGGGSGGRDILGDGGSDGASCQPTSCETQGKSCGAIADGCGSTIDCGTCGDGEVCGLGAANVCAGIDDVCVRQAQESACQGKECGVVGDGCGGTYLCGSCADTETCGLEAAYQCATNPNGSLTECPGLITSCASVGANCGIIGNGCGGTIDCDQETGGCGPDELCGYDSSAPQTCAVFDVCVPLDPTDACAGTCGKVSNGCGPEVDGGFIDCDALAVGGGCTGGDTCGGGGVPFECGQGGSVSCTADPDACAGRTCGFASDGCGDSVDCSGGTGCGNGTQCVDGTCEAILGCSVIDQPTACAGKECGEVSDNCGGTYDCGSCTGNETCGRVTAFQCDYVPTPGPGCVGLNQAEACAGKECNIAYDGCGTAAANTFNCGPNGGACTGSDVCGAQAAYQCDPMPTPPACTPNGATCASMGWACGVAVGNCGQLIDCADEGRSCPSTQACVGGITGPTTCSAVIGNNGA